MKNLLMISLFLFAAAGADAAQCVRYEGLDHCSIEDARLKLSPNGSRLGVMGLGADGDDGVATLLGSANFWAAKMKVADLGPGRVLNIASISNGFMTSGLRMRATESGWQLTADFTGAVDLGRFGIILVGGDDDPPVDGPGGLGPGTIIDLIPLDHIFPPEVEGEIDDTVEVGFGAGQTTTPTARRQPAKMAAQTELGACFWTAELSGSVRVYVDGALIGEATGVHLVEEVGGPGHYPYDDFDGMRIQSNAKAIVFQDEISISNGF